MAVRPSGARSMVRLDTRCRVKVTPPSYVHTMSCRILAKSGRSPSEDPIRAWAKELGYALEVAGVDEVPGTGGQGRRSPRNRRPDRVERRRPVITTSGAATARPRPANPGFRPAPISARSQSHLVSPRVALREISSRAKRHSLCDSYYCHNGREVSRSGRAASSALEPDQSDRPTEDRNGGENTNWRPTHVLVLLKRRRRNAKAR